MIVPHFPRFCKLKSPAGACTAGILPAVAWASCPCILRERDAPATAGGTPALQQAALQLAGSTSGWHFCLPHPLPAPKSSPFRVRGDIFGVAVGFLFATDQMIETYSTSAARR